MTRADLSHALLTSDFYSFQDLLTPDENAHVMEIREFLERDLRPIADDYWDRAEFPMQLIPEVGRLGMLGSVWPETQRFENSALYRGWVALELGAGRPRLRHVRRESRTG